MVVWGDFIFISNFSFRCKFSGIFFPACFFHCRPIGKKSATSKVAVWYSSGGEVSRKVVG